MQKPDRIARFLPSDADLKIRLDLDNYRFPVILYWNILINNVRGQTAMTAKQRRLRRQQLDSQLGALALSATPPRPQGGWIHAIRESLGMTLDAFGARLGTSRQTAHQLEHAEATDSITVRRLRAAAEALECELVIVLRPKQPLNDILGTRARAVARQVVLRTGHSMAMEDQAVSNARLEDMVAETAADLIEKGDTRIWQ